MHIGYAHYRKQLIAMGVKINELRPDPGPEKTKLASIGSAKASPHTKALVVDR